MKMHTGETRCPICHKEFAVMRNMRRHMVQMHRMSQQEVANVTNKRHRLPSNYRVLLQGGQVPEVSMAAAGTPTESGGLSRTPTEAPDEGDAV